jgi:hypothetical protein
MSGKKKCLYIILKNYFIRGNQLKLYFGSIYYFLYKLMNFFNIFYICYITYIT